VTIATPIPDNTPQPDFGVTTFERVTHTMSKITGVPFTNPTVFALYNAQQQSLPSTPLISAFVPSQQTAIGQLAGAYCAQLVSTAALRDAFFGTGLDASLTQSASFFNTASNRQIVETALVKNAVGVSVSPATATAVTNEVDALLQRIPTLSETPAPTVATATQAACSAVLGSAAVTLQ